MILPSEFIMQWVAENQDDPSDTGLLRFSPMALDDVKMPEADRAFLIEAGLPESAAPFLDFEQPVAGPLPTLSKHADLPEAFRRYRVIGFDGSGDFICIDQDQGGTIVSINHDDDNRPNFMNSSIPQLAESLLLYQRLVRRTIQANGEDAFMDNNISDDLREWFASEMRRVDGVALAEDGFWKGELIRLETPYI